MYKYIVAFDPSGSFKEGKGTTGWVLMDYKERLLERGYTPASDYKCPEEYWNGVLDVLYKYHNRYKGELIVVIEDYVLYRDRSENQTNSQMETCRLIGVMLWTCWRLNQPYTLQLAASVKNRWSDELLLREGIIYRRGRDLRHSQSDLSLALIHTRDAFRHAIHYAVCRNEKPKTKGYYKSFKPPKGYSSYEDDYEEEYYNDYKRNRKRHSY